jgi:hypothetical protein
VLVASLLALAMAGPAAAQEAVDLELVLLADATSSIDAVEHALQRRGYAAALIDPEVVDAIEAGGALGRIAVAYVEWASRRRQDLVVDWALIEDAAGAQAFAERIVAAPRRVHGVNAIGAALLKAVELIEANRFEGFRKVIDLSGDSAWNPRPPTLAEARAAALDAGIVINALAVLCDACSGRQGAGNLEAQFAERLIAGPGAFVVTADSRASFADAVRRKLVLEIAGLGTGTGGACSHSSIAPRVAAGEAKRPARGTDSDAFSVMGHGHLRLKCGGVRASPLPYMLRTGFGWLRHGGGIPTGSASAASRADALR